MKRFAFILIVLLALLVSGPANAITVGVTLDVHQDCQIADLQKLPNDFHVEGKIESFGIPPVLTSHADGPFSPPGGTFSYTITKVDPANPADPWYTFTGDWSFPAGSAGIPYCTICHFGLVFDVGEKNTIINLIGWWTRDGVKIGDVITGNNFVNKGYVPAAGFNVSDDPTGLGQSMRITNGIQQSPQFPPSNITPPLIPIQIVAMDLVSFPAGQEPSIDELKEGGGLNWNWIHVVKPDGTPIGTNNPQPLSPNSFFDVFFDVPRTGQLGVPQGQQFTIPSGGSLVARVKLQFLNNSGVTEERWQWDIHGQPTLPTQDFGDAPDQPYQTLLASNGARHIIVKDFHLGQFVDAELDGQPDPNAMGDDLALTPDDEDGVTFTTPLQVGQNAQIKVNATIPASMPGKLDAWIDFNGNGSWTDPGEQIFTSALLINGNNTLNFTVPATAVVGPTFARFRLTDTGGQTPKGLVQNGEVEDYKVGIEPGTQTPTLDFGDAPDQPYPTLLASNGARHIIVTGFHLGQFIDAEFDGQPDPNATGDDLALTPDDEDGVTFTTTPQVGQIAQIAVNAAIPGTMTGKLDAWIDFNADGDWNDAGEQIFASVALVTGNTNLTFAVPTTALAGPTFARFRLTDIGGQTPVGLAKNGEVEDYSIRILAAPQLLDFGDAPDVAGSLLQYPTLLVNDGARHIKVDKFYLGSSIDTEADGQPNATATGDDVNGLDDEDGVTFTTPLQVGQIAQIAVNATIPGTMTGKLDAWIDFNHNGNWTDPGEQIFTSTAIVNGSNTLNFIVPAAALVGGTFARFRLTDTGGQTPKGLAQNGEVEDYQIGIEQAPQEILDFGDAPDNPQMLSQYPTLLIHNGARHTISPNMRLGAAIDSEPNGQPNANATGDDIAGIPDDEDGVFFNAIYLGCWAKVKVIATMPGKINAWMDFNHNGNWGDPGDQIFVNKPVNPGINWLYYYVPPNAMIGPTFTRFRYNTVGGLSFTGPATDGEVEDYQVQIKLKPIIVTKAKAKLLPIGTEVVLEKNIITANFGIKGWYFEEPSRAAGIGVIVGPDNPAPWSLGNVVSCVGTTTLNGGELMIQEECSWSEGAAIPLKAVGQNNRNSGGGKFGNQPGVVDTRESPTSGRQSVALNSIGLFVRIWGKCTYVETDVSGAVLNAWLDDGSSLWDGTYTPRQMRANGIKVHFETPPTIAITVGKYYATSGIMRTVPAYTGDFARCLWESEIVGIEP